MRNNHCLPKKPLWLALGRVFSRGVATLPLPKNHHLPRSQTKRAVEADGPDGTVDSLRSRLRGNRAHSPLENLRFPTGPWTRFEEALGGCAPTAPTARDFLRLLFPSRKILMCEARDAILYAPA